MKAVKGYRYLYRRGDQLCFRRRVPLNARSAFDGKEEVQKSLGTSTIAEARHLLAIEVATFDKMIADAAGKPVADAVRQIVPSKKPSAIEMEEAVRKWLSERVERGMNSELASTSPDDVQQVWDGLQVQVENVKQGICAYTGARVNEITQLRAEDVKNEKGIWTIYITPEAGGVKDGTARTVALHPHLLEQGFHRTIAGKSGPLFYDPALHRGGSEGNPQYKKVGEFLARWVREVGVDDPNVPPNHGWRHRFKTEARRVGMDAETRDAIQGHAPRTEGEGYGNMPIEPIWAAIRKLNRYKIGGP
ncbi:MAG: hypothetical protein B7Y88_04390 [Sphingomonadales bacterium 32-64-17]|nr:MAG: hypothetical protein B7Y88_04390 [Sphingomonadales bacterium 32-64-17]